MTDKEKLEKLKKSNKRLDKILSVGSGFVKLTAAGVVVFCIGNWALSGGGIHSEIGGSASCYEAPSESQEDLSNSESLALELLGYQDKNENEIQENTSEELFSLDDFEEEKNVILPLYNEEDGTIEEQNPDQVVSDYYQKFKTKIQANIESGNLEQMKEIGSKAFIKTVDFLFYNEPITKYGITRDMITKQAYQDLMSDMALIDSIIVQYDPDYKEEFGEKYVKAMYLYDKAKTGLKEYIVNRIGQDAYDAAGETKDALVEKGKGKLSEVKEFMKSHYENFRSTHVK